MDMMEYQVKGGRDSQSSLSQQLEYLDSLFEKYLHILHEYENARQDLSRQFSSGFFNLAQANRSVGPGRHYGQDYYDERMHASRRVRLDEEGIKIAKAPKAEEDEKGKEKEQKDSFSDPLRWFGILVPPALRAAQTDFAIAVDGPIPRIVNLTKQMHQLEHDIARLRKSIKKLRVELGSGDSEGLVSSAVARAPMEML